MKEQNTLLTFPVTYLQSRNKDLKKKCLEDKRPRGHGGLIWETGIDPTVELRGFYSMLCGDLNGEEIQNGGDWCVPNRFSCDRLCDPMDCGPPDSSVHGISQAKILEWLPFPPPRNLSHPEIKPESPALAGRFFTPEPPGKSQILITLVRFHVLCKTLQMFLVFNFLVHILIII